MRKALLAVASVLFAVGLFRFTEEGVILADTYDILDMAAGAVTLLVALNVFLLGFLAELQIKASRFFKRHIAVIAREAAR